MKTDKAAQAYADFRGVWPQRVVKTTLPDREVIGWHMGDIEAIDYRTERDGELQLFRHDFKTGCGPSIVVDENGRDVYLTGGDFDVTSRGFEDEPMKRKSNPALVIMNPVPPLKRKARTMAKPGRNAKGQFVKRGKARSSTKRRTNPAPARTRKRASKPRKTTSRRRRSSSNVPAVQVTKTVYRRRNPAPARTRKYGTKGKLHLMTLVQDGAMQAAGAIAASVAWSFLIGLMPHLPDQYKTGLWAAGGKAAVGAAGGMAVAHFVDKNMGQQFASGAFTVASVDVMTHFLPRELGGNMSGPYDYNYEPMGAMLEREDMGAMLDQQDLGQIVYDSPEDMDYITAGNSVEDIGNIGYTGYSGIFGPNYV